MSTRAEETRGDMTGRMSGKASRFCLGLLAFFRPLLRRLRLIGNTSSRFSPLALFPTFLLHTNMLCIARVSVRHRVSATIRRRLSTSARKSERQIKPGATDAAGAPNRWSYGISASISRRCGDPIAPTLLQLAHTRNTGRRVQDRCPCPVRVLAS